jgi:hypothetical protein
MKDKIENDRDTREQLVLAMVESWDMDDLFAFAVLKLEQDFEFLTDDEFTEIHKDFHN